MKVLPTAIRMLHARSVQTAAHSFEVATLDKGVLADRYRAIACRTATAPSADWDSFLRTDTTAKAITTECFAVNNALWAAHMAVVCVLLGCNISQGT
jgi:hypothetical protein